MKSILIPEHRQKLKARGLTDDIIDASRIHSAHNGEALEVLGALPDGVLGHWPGLVIPFLSADGAETGYARFRPDWPVTDNRGKKRKYESPRRKPNEIYIPPKFAALAKEAPYIVVTEGEFKALAGQSHGIPTVGLVGVYGWCRERPKDKGRPVGKKMLHPALAEIVAMPGKRFVVLFDSDAIHKPEVRTAARELARCIHEAGPEVAIVFPPPSRDGGKQGMDDYIAAEGVEALRELIESTPSLTEDDLAGEEVLIQNYIVREEQRGEKKVLIKVGLSLSQISERFARITGHWPRLCGERLFVDDHGTLRWIEDDVDLFATIQSKGAVRWASGADSKAVNMISRREFHSHLKATAPRYAAVSAYPFEPRRDDTYTTWRPPADYTPTGEHLAGLLSPLPSTTVDESLIRSLFLTMLWGGPPGGRPLFVITGDCTGRQEVGKTTLVEKLANVVGGPFRVRLEQVGAFGDSVGKQLVSTTAQDHRVITIDNVTGVLRSSELADLVTAANIDGRASHGKQTRRTNLMTWTATTNDLALSSDLATRCVVVRLRAPDRDSNPGWEADVDSYIASHRDLILADALAAIRGPRYPVATRRNRFPSWCEEILSLEPGVNDILPALQRGVIEADADADEIEQFMTELRTLARTLADPTTFSPKYLAEVWNVANRDRLTTGWVIRRIKAARARGKLVALRPKSTMHGCDWVPTDEFWGEQES